MAQAKLNFSNSRNLMIVTLILVTGLAGVKVPIGEAIVLEGIGLSALVGMLFNFVLHVLLPDDPDND